MLRAVWLLLVLVQTGCLTHYAFDHLVADGSVEPRPEGLVGCSVQRVGATGLNVAVRVALTDGRELLMSPSSNLDAARYLHIPEAVRAPAGPNYVDAELVNPGPLPRGEVACFAAEERPADRALVLHYALADGRREAAPTPFTEADAAGVRAVWRYARNPNPAFNDAHTTLQLWLTEPASAPPSPDAPAPPGEQFRVADLDVILPNRYSRSGAVAFAALVPFTVLVDVITFPFQLVAVMVGFSSYNP